MPQKILQILLTLTLALTPLLPSLAAATTTAATIHDHLRRNGLPQGLFPTNSTSFTYNATSGTFTVTFPQPCNAKGDNELHFDLNVTGTMSYAKIGNLSGMSSLELFLWFPVHGIRVDVPSSGIVHFDVGVADKKISAAAFESPLDCTAGDVGDRSFDAASFENWNPLDEPRYKADQGDILHADS